MFRFRRRFACAKVHVLVVREKKSTDTLPDNPEFRKFPAEVENCLGKFLVVTQDLEDFWMNVVLVQHVGKLSGDRLLRGFGTQGIFYLR